MLWNTYTTIKLLLVNSCGRCVRHNPGKVDAGGSDLDQVVESEQAVETALQAFIDGLYFVFLDEQQQENLDEIVTLQPHSQLLFLRLVPLVGG